MATTHCTLSWASDTLWNNSFFNSSMECPFQCAFICYYHMMILLISGVNIIHKKSYDYMLRNPCLMACNILAPSLTMSMVSTEIS